MIDPKELQPLFDRMIEDYALKNQNRPSKIPFHEHNGTDSPLVNIIVKTFLVTDSTAAPTDTPQNGTIRILYDTNSWNIWVRVNNLWKTISLT